MTILAEWIATGGHRRAGRPQSLKLFASAGLPDSKERLTFKRRESRRRKVMYKRIVLAVDLAEPTPAPKGLAQAIELAKMGAGELRLVNVQPVIPATFMEYVPVDFDVEQENRAKEALGAILGGIDLPAERKS